MGELYRSRATLRLFGEALDPDEVTRLLGAEPTASCRRGDPHPRARPGSTFTERRGSWRLGSDYVSPGNLSAQIRGLLAEVTDDLDVWRGLVARFDCDVFCGLFLSRTNQGESVEPDVLRMLGERGLLLDLDIYAYLHGGGRRGLIRRRPSRSGRSERLPRRGRKRE